MKVMITEQKLKSA